VPWRPDGSETGGCEQTFNRAELTDSELEYEDAMGR
jgi:hypothetical protein